MLRPAAWPWQNFPQSLFSRPFYCWRPSGDACFCLLHVSFTFNCRRGDSMRAGAFKAFYGGIAFLAVCAAGFLSGCASGHKQFVYVAGPGTNETFEFRIQADGSLAPLGTPHFPVGSNPVARKPDTFCDLLYMA